MQQIPFKGKKIIIVIQYFIAGKSRKIYFLKTTPMVDQSKRDCKLPLLVPCIEQWSLADGQGTLSMKEDASLPLSGRPYIPLSGKNLPTSCGKGCQMTNWLNQTDQTKTL